MIHFDFPYIIFVFEVGGFTHHFCVPEESFMMFFDLFLLVIFLTDSTMVNHQEIHHLEAYFYVFPKSKSKLLNGMILQPNSKQIPILLPSNFCWPSPIPKKFLVT